MSLSEINTKRHDDTIFYQNKNQVTSQNVMNCATPGGYPLPQLQPPGPLYEREDVHFHQCICSEVSQINVLTGHKS